MKLWNFLTKIDFPLIIDRLKFPLPNQRQTIDCVNRRRFHLFQSKLAASFSIRFIFLLLCAYKSHLLDPFFIKSIHNENIYSIDEWEGTWAREIQCPKTNINPDTGRHPFHEWIRFWFISVWKSNKIVLFIVCRLLSVAENSVFWDHNFIHATRQFFTSPDATMDALWKCISTSLCADLLMLLWNKSWHAEFVIHKLPWCNVAHFCGKLHHTSPSGNINHSLVSFTISPLFLTINCSGFRLTSLQKKLKSIVSKKIGKVKYDNEKKFATRSVMCECGLMWRKAEDEEEMRRRRWWKGIFLIVSRNQGNEWKLRNKKEPRTIGIWQVWHFLSSFSCEIIAKTLKSSTSRVCYILLSFWSSMTCNPHNPIILKRFASLTTFSALNFLFARLCLLLLWE